MKYYVGETITLRVPWSWMNWRQRLALCLDMIHLHRLARLSEPKRIAAVITKTDGETGTITVDAP